MVVAVAYAVVAALCWGVADFVVARLGDRTTTLATFAHTQVGGLAAIVAFAAAVGVARPPAGRLPALLALGLAGVVAYLLLYAALQVGPVAVASPLAATNGAVAAVLGVALLGESLGTAGTAGLVLVTAGVVGASVEPERIRETLAGGTGAVAPGAALAALAALAGGATLFAFETVTAGVSLVVTLLGVRVVGAAVALPLLPPNRFAGRPDATVRALAVGVGVLDVAGLAGFVLGLRTGRVAVVAPVSSLFAVVTVLLAWALLSEPLSTVQRVGVGLVLAGTPLLASV